MDNSKTLIRGVMVSLVATVLVVILPALGLDVDLASVADWASDGKLTLSEVLGFVGVILAFVAAKLANRNLPEVSKAKKK